MCRVRDRAIRLYIGLGMTLAIRVRGQHRVRDRGL
jgi:hypothetical protein